MAGRKKFCPTDKQYSSNTDKRLQQQKQNIGKSIGADPGGTGGDAYPPIILLGGQYRHCPPNNFVGGTI
jgi:hypothetical protein